MTETVVTTTANILALDNKLWAILVGLTGLAGFASWVVKAATKKFTRFSIFDLIGEMAFSITIGISVFLYSESAEYNQLLLVAAAVISAHQSTRIVYLSSNLISSYAEKIMPKTEDPIEIIAKQYGLKEAELITLLEKNRKNNG